jgi:hypothetical protein
MMAGWMSARAIDKSTVHAQPKVRLQIFDLKAIFTLIPRIRETRTVNFFDTKMVRCQAMDRGPVSALQDFGHRMLPQPERLRHV